MNFSFFFSGLFFGSLTVVLSIFVFVVQRFHFIISLLCLEFIVLGLFILTLSGFGFLGEGFLVFFLLSFAACEAALGLGLLVRLVRSHGRDFLGIIRVYEC